MHGDGGNSVEFPLPQRQPGEDTERIHYNERFETHRRPYFAPGDVTVLPGVVEVSRPPWGPFDTFLRRAAMIGVVVLLWTVILGGIGAAVGAGWVAHRFGDASTVQNYQPDPCEIDPTTDGC
jgi:hypothetical protein